MSAVSVDFPDWNPPRDRAALRSVDTLFATLPAGDSVNYPYAPVQVDNVVIVAGILAPSTAIHLGTAEVFGPVETLRGAINAGPTDVPFTMVTNFVGGTIQVELVNASGVDWGYTMFVETVAGVVPDQTLPEQLMRIVNDLTVPATADADAFVVGDAGMYTHATVIVQCDQPYEVIVRRSWLNLDPTPAIVSADELAATAASAGDTISDVAVGANGFAIVVRGTGATPGTASVVVRLDRPGGF